MAELVNLGAWIEGECEAQELVFKLAEEIISAKIPDHKITGEKHKNNWSKVFTSEGDMWVTYTQKTTKTDGTYIHDDGKSYNVYKITRPTGMSGIELDPDTDTYKIYKQSTYVTGVPPFSGETITFGEFTYTDVTNKSITVNLEGQLCVFIPNDDATSYTGHLVEQYRKTSKNGMEKNGGWDSFKIVAELPASFTKYYKNGKIEEHFGYGNSSMSSSKIDTLPFNITPRYSYNKISYTADTTHVAQPCAVLRALPSGKDGTTTNSEAMFVLLEQPSADYNHITMRYGKGCIAVESSGNPLATYADACDPLTVRFNNKPTIIDQSKAHEIYLDWNTSTTPVFVPYSIEWGLDYDGVTPLVSPLTRFYHGRHSTVSWVVNKKRRPDYIVDYSISVTSDRVMIILEGDPSPGINDYYRSFAYIGKIIPFNDSDHAGNFGITCGMGDLKAEMTDYTLADISEKNNPEYAKWGEYTSNGMYSFSMFDTRSKVKYQAYYPAFLTQLPNYSDVGTIPPHLSNLILDNDGFQPSIWTDKYHASPIYLVHQAEGYRGYMDGVVAIHDHNLINLDELLVDTEIPKDENDPSQGNYIEVYKFFSLKSPVNMFKYSPAPDVITVAIIKDIE